MLGNSPNSLKEIAEKSKLFFLIEIYNVIFHADHENLSIISEIIENEDDIKHK